MIYISVKIEFGVMLKGFMVIGLNCFVGVYVYLCGGVFLDERVSIGLGCEIKFSMLFMGILVVYFNFIGDSIVGS